MRGRCCGGKPIHIRNWATYSMHSRITGRGEGGWNTTRTTTPDHDRLPDIDAPAPVTLGGS
jgi:hypothetical protein